MKDYYSILGINRSSSDDDIKKAYRKAAMKHHPDRGGDEKTFKEIEEAYRVLSDPEKKSMVDQGIDPNNHNHRQYHGGGFNDMEDMFNAFGFNFHFGPRNHIQKNKNLSINLTLTLEEAYTGMNKSLSISYPNGVEKIINVSIPAGVDNGMAIRFSGMGDHSISNLPPGDLNVLIRVQPHSKFAREGLNLLTDINIDCFDAILGTDVNITTLDHRTLQVSIPPGTQPNTTLRIKNEGMRDERGNFGMLYVRVGVHIPKINDPVKLQQLYQIKN
jgi:DnaJ-class molecular chaperone